MRPQDKVARTSPQRGRKNRARWCGGHVGREHEPEIQFDKAIETLRRIDPLRYDTRCRWALWTVRGRLVTAELNWSCGHQLVCKDCGRILRFRIDRAACPQWKPKPAGPVSKLQCQCDHQLLRHREFDGCTECGCRSFVLANKGKK